mmetsp:Transcript_16973/g.55527  ORF Transcript_16973/g.55527 Transcript_16973/m.55527 type:complete len:156 (+) Transcript_16973:142-609(+)
MASFELPTDPAALSICDGFAIVSMNMRDATTGKIVWEETKWPNDWQREEVAAHIPASILQCSEVSRELVFSSKEQISNFALVQRVFLFGQQIEEWRFDFGFVIPGSTNSWQSTIAAAGEGKMLDPAVASGQLVIETTFQDGENLINRSLVRVHYV